MLELLLQKTPLELVAYAGAASLLLLSAAVAAYVISLLVLAWYSVVHQYLSYKAWLFSLPALVVMMVKLLTYVGVHDAAIAAVCVLQVILILAYCAGKSNEEDEKAKKDENLAIAQAFKEFLEKKREEEDDRRKRFSDYFGNRITETR